MSSQSSYIPSTAALRTFEVAARRLSFTITAEELGLTQGAVSHQIRELESRLGVKLFQRQARGISLSAAGKTYLPFAAEALARLKAGAAALTPAVSGSVLTVSCSPNFAAKWLVPRLGAFSAAHGDIDLRISAAMRHVSFAGDGIDLAVRHGNGDWPDLDVTRLCPETLFPVCSPHYLGSAPDLRTIEDLNQQLLLHDRDHSGWAAWLEQIGADLTSYELTRGSVFSQTSLAIDAAVAGQGIALARSALAGLELAAGRLIRPLPHEIAAGFAYWIVCPEATAANPNIERFRSWLLREAEIERT